MEAVKKQKTKDNGETQAGYFLTVTSIISKGLNTRFSSAGVKISSAWRTSERASGWNARSKAT